MSCFKQIQIKPWHSKDPLKSKESNSLVLFIGNDSDVRKSQMKKGISIWSHLNISPHTLIHSGVIHFRPDKLPRVQQKRNPHLCVDLRAFTLTKLCHWDGVVILVAFKAESDEGRFMEDFLRYKHTVHTPPASCSSRQVKSDLEKGLIHGARDVLVKTQTTQAVWSVIRWTAQQHSWA